MTTDVKETAVSENGCLKEDNENRIEQKLDFKSSSSIKQESSSLENKSSTEILTELFSAFNAEPPVIEEVSGDGDKPVKNSKKNSVNHRSSESGEEDSTSDKVKEKKGEKKKKEKKKKHKHKSSKHRHSSKKESDSSGINRLHRSREKDKDDIATYSKIKEKILKASASNSKQTTDKLNSSANEDSYKGRIDTRCDVVNVITSAKNSVRDEKNNAGSKSLIISTEVNDQSKFFDHSSICLPDDVSKPDDFRTEAPQGKNVLDPFSVNLLVSCSKDTVEAIEVDVIPLPEDCASQELSSSENVKPNDYSKCGVKEEIGPDTENNNILGPSRTSDHSYKCERNTKKDGRLDVNEGESFSTERLDPVHLAGSDKNDISNGQKCLKVPHECSEHSGSEKSEHTSNEKCDHAGNEKTESSSKNVKSSSAVPESKTKSKIKIKNLKFSTVFQQTLKEAEEQARKKEEEKQEEEIKGSSECDNLDKRDETAKVTSDKPVTSEPQHLEVIDSENIDNSHSSSVEPKVEEQTLSVSKEEVKGDEKEKSINNGELSSKELETSLSIKDENDDHDSAYEEQEHLLSDKEESVGEPEKEKVEKNNEAPTNKRSRSRSVSKCKVKEKKKRRKSRSKSREKSKKSKKRSKSPAKAKSRSRSRRRSRSPKEGRNRKRSRSASKGSKRKKRSRSRSKGGKRSRSKGRKKSRSRSKARKRSTSKERRKKSSRSRSKSTKRSESKEERKKVSRSRSKSRKRSASKGSKRSRSASKERKKRSRSESRKRSQSYGRKSRSKSRSRSGKRSRSRKKSRSRSRKRSRSKRKSRSRSRRSRSRSGRTRSRRKSRSRSRKRSRSKSQRKSRSRSRRKSRSRSRKKSRSRSRKKSRSRSRKKSRSRSRKKSRSRSRKKSRSRSRRKSRSRSRSRRKSRSRSRRKSRSRSRRKSRSRSRRKSRSRSRRKSRSRSRRKSRSRSRRKSRSRSRKRSKSRRRSRSRKRSLSLIKCWRRSRSRSRKRSRDRSKRSKSKGRRSKSRSKSKGRRSRSKGRSRSRKRSGSRKQSRSRSEKRSRSRSEKRSKSAERRSRSRSRKRFRGSSAHDKEKESRRSKTVEKSKLAAAGGTESTGASSITSGDGGKSGEGEEEKLDKARLLEIARKNAVNLLQQGSLPPSVVGKDQKGKLLSLKAGGKSVEELTEYCKELSRKEAMGESSESDGEGGSGCGSHVAPVIHHPFQIKERPTPGMIGIGIRSSLPPANAIMDKPSDQSKLRMQFPVSSGQEHRKTESDSPLAICYHEEAAIVEDTNSLSGDVPEEKEKIIIDPKDQVFPDYSNCENMDIGSIVSQRLTALRKLQENPDDVDALNEMTQAQKDMQVWAESKSQPGLFTGSTGAKVLSAAELASGSQAWARKDQLKCATPLTGGMGMLLLQKMGWRPGEGLGKNKEGVLEPLKLDVKTDKRGLVSQEELHRHTNVHRRGHITRSHSRHSFGKHPVSVLVEICSKRRWKVPHFQLVFESGPDHKKSFLFKAIVNGVEYLPPAPSPNKKQAKAHAASICLQAIGVYPPSMGYDGACV